MQRNISTLVLTSLIVGVFWSPSVRASLGINITLEENYFIQYEPILATVSVRNYTGNTLVFAAESDDENRNAYLVFEGDDQNDISVPRVNKGRNPAKGLILGAGETRSLTVRLNDFLNLQEKGTYSIRVRVGHPFLRSDFASDPVTVHVREGEVVWTKSIGVPQGGAAQPIQLRDASLLRFRHKEGELYVFRLEDERMVHAIIRMGPCLAYAPPNCQVDAISNVHILIRIRPRIFSYAVIDFNGKEKQKIYYAADEASGVPRLRYDGKLGRVQVVGGRKAVPDVDYVE